MPNHQRPGITHSLRFRSVTCSLAKYLATALRGPLSLRQSDSRRPSDVSPLAAHELPLFRQFADKYPAGPLGFAYLEKYLLEKGTYLHHFWNGGVLRLPHFPNFCQPVSIECRTAAADWGLVRNGKTIHLPYLFQTRLPAEFMCSGSVYYSILSSKSKLVYIIFNVSTLP